MEEFATALRTAITNRGLGLERIREHLSQHGVTVSLATLSYWQSGRSRPERKASLQAVVHLEHVLQLTPGHLSELLGPPRSRGRWLRPAPAAMSAFWPEPSQVEHALHDLIEHELVNQPPCPIATNYERKFRLPTREYVLEVTFEGAPPTSVTQLADGTSVTPGRTLLDVALDVQPGVRGFSWKWS